MMSFSPELLEAARQNYLILTSEALEGRDGGRAEPPG